METNILFKEVVFKMRTKKHIASAAICCAALAIPLVTQCPVGISVAALDYTDIVEFNASDENDYFSLSDNEFIAKKSGYYGVIVGNSNGSYSYVTCGCQETATTLEDAVSSYIASKGIPLQEIGGRFYSLAPYEAVYYIMYSNDGVTADYICKAVYDGSNIDAEPVATPQFWAKPNAEKTAARDDGAVVYSVRAKMDYDAFESWDDTSVPQGVLLRTLDSVSCRTRPEDDTPVFYAAVDGFDSGTVYDEFDICFFSNGVYTLYVSDSSGAYSYLDIEVTSVSNEVHVDNPYENLDLTAPKLTIEVPDGDYLEGSTVKVKVTSDEPCVMLIGGEAFGDSDNLVTEAIYEATYNARYSVVATDASFNTTQTSFEVSNFVAIEDATDENGIEIGVNPYTPDKRATYWETANLSNPNGDIGGANDAAGTGKLPQTGEEITEESGVNVPLVVGSSFAGLAAVGGFLYAFRKKIFKRGGAK